MVDRINNWREAQTYAEGVLNRAARTTMSIVHHVLLECSGIYPMAFLSTELSPTSPTDVLVFYKSIEIMFARDSQSPTRDDCKENLVERPEHIDVYDLATQCSNVVARGLLFRWIRTIASLGSDSVVRIDVFFCCQVLALIFENDETRQRILDAKNADECGEPEW
jgi:hypothetical protein